MSWQEEVAFLYPFCTRPIYAWFDFMVLTQLNSLKQL